jgi:hypothetical protein
MITHDEPIEDVEIGELGEFFLFFWDDVMEIPGWIECFPGISSMYQLI